VTAALPDPSALALSRQPPIPVAVLTGFLGSGKTTLIRSLLRNPAFEGTAVVVNEFGEVGLDHLLVEAAQKEDMILLEGGCLCCATRGDLVRALRSLLDRRERAELPAYRRVIVETSGLADPAPILQTLLSDPLRLSRYRFARLTAAVDGMLGAETLQRYDEASRQVALADGVFLTKTDLADETQLAAASAAVRTLSAAPIASGVLGQGAGAELFWPAAESINPGDLNVHHAHCAYFTVTRSLGRPLAWPRVEAWLGEVVDQCGTNLLRLKAILAIEGEAAPVVLHAVQHVIHRPERLPAWPEGMAQGRIVIIGQGPDPARVDRLLANLLDGSRGQP
jgi:G3E family GTPase